MPARPRSARAGTEGNNRATRPPMRVRGLCPRTLSAKRRNQNQAKAKLSCGALGWEGYFGSHFVFAAELEAAL